MRTLYHITAEMAAINDALELAGGEITEQAEADALLTAYLDSLMEDQEAKADAYVSLIKQLGMEAAAAKAEAEQWAHRAKSREKRAEYLQERLLQHMIATKQSEIVTKTGRKLRVQVNSVAPVKVDEIPWADVPDEFLAVRYDFDRTAIRHALAAGRSLPFARFGERGTHLRIV